jgi:hypothetical protein
MLLLALPLQVLLLRLIAQSICGVCCARLMMRYGCRGLLCENSAFGKVQYCQQNHLLKFCRSRSQVTDSTELVGSVRTANLCSVADS